MFIDICINDMSISPEGTVICFQIIILYVFIDICINDMSISSEERDGYLFSNYNLICVY